MNWAFWAIPLIGLAVWVLSTIFRDLDERMEKERRAKRETADAGGRARVPRQSNNELDRFLEEARRRRESAPKKRAEKPPRQQQPVLTAQPVDPPRRKPMAAPVERPVPTMKPAEEVQAVLATPAPTVTPPPSAAPVPAARTASRGEAPPRRPPAAIAQLRNLLGDRNSLAAAFLLREVFDAPLSVRRRRDRA
ncbi:MAG: hypothetical protein U0736_13680 [Gemmataceae bacterium]